jgi:hypothetical protein
MYDIDLCWSLHREVICNCCHHESSHLCTVMTTFISSSTIKYNYNKWCEGSTKIIDFIVEAVANDLSNVDLNLCSSEVVASTKMEVMTGSWVRKCDYLRHVCTWATSTLIAEQSPVSSYYCFYRTIPATRSSLLGCQKDQYGLGILAKGGLGSVVEQVMQSKCSYYLLPPHGVQWFLLVWVLGISSSHEGWLYILLLFYTIYTVVFYLSYSFVPSKKVKKVKLSL